MRVDLPCIIKDCCLIPKQKSLNGTNVRANVRQEDSQPNRHTGRIAHPDAPIDPWLEPGKTRSRTWHYVPASSEVRKRHQSGGCKQIAGDIDNHERVAEFLFRNRRPDARCRCRPGLSRDKKLVRHASNEGGYRFEPGIHQDCRPKYPKEDRFACSGSRKKS